MFSVQLAKRLLNCRLVWTFKYINTYKKTTGASSYIIIYLSTSEHSEIKYFISCIFLYFVLVLDIQRYFLCLNLHLKNEQKMISWKDYHYNLLFVNQMYRLR